MLGYLFSPSDCIRHSSSLTTDINVKGSAWTHLDTKSVMIFRRYLLAVIYVIILTLIVYILQQDGAGIISAIKLKYTGMRRN